MNASQGDGSTEFQDWQKRNNICYLSDLKFAGVKPIASDEHADEKGEKASPTTYMTQDPAQYQGGTEGLRGGRAYSRPHRYDKLASDKPGEELAPDSSIWRMYAEEAKGHDRDLVERRNNNLDTMLLFAGLFSAILTAFLVESTNLLEPDLTETSVALLLDIAQSQRRTENGDQATPLPPIDLPTFQPSASARWINALWFMALALSLGAAMMAMLAKEWLEEFVAGTPVHPHEYARERQSRLDALTSWNTLRIIDFLPTLLHFSLVLFTLGLIVNLWRLDQVVALILAAASVGLFIWYATVVILGAVREQCPYRTRVSKYLRRVLDKYRSGNNSNSLKEKLRILKPRRKSGKKRPEFEGTTLADLRALEWLTSEARDPAVGDSAYQALAGLRTRAIKLTTDKTITREVVRTTPQDTEPHSTCRRPRWFWNWSLTGERTRREIHSETSSMLEGNSTVISMAMEIIERLRTARISSPRELAFCRGTNVARYASALPEIYHHVRDCVSQLQQQWEGKGGKSQDLAERLGMIEQVKESSFKALDMIWSDDCPPFTADAYAELTAAELKLTGLAADEVIAHRPSANPLQEEGKNVSSSTPHASIPVLTDTGSKMERHDSLCWPVPWISGTRSILKPSSASTPKAGAAELSNLRARYSRALCRSAFQLAFHSSGRAPIGNYALINLLETMSTLSENDALDSKEHMITHYPQHDNNLATTIYAFIPANSCSYFLPPNDIGDEDGLLAGLTNILGSSSLKAVPKVETAAIKSMKAIAPKLIKKWVELQRDVETPIPTFKALEDAYSSELDWNWEMVSHNAIGDLQPRERAVVVITYLVKVASFAMAFFDYPGACQLPDVSIKALYTGTKARASAETWDAAYNAIAGRPMLLKQWIMSIGRSGSQYPRGRVWNRESKAYLLRLLAVRNQAGRSILLEVLVRVKNDEDAQEVPLIVLETMAEASGEVSETETLLEAILSSTRSEDVDGKYSGCFTRTSDGFEALRGVGSHPKHADHVSATITNLIIFLAHQDAKWIEFDVVPAFLGNISFVCKHPPPDRLGGAPLKTFLSRVAVSLEGLVGSITFATEDSTLVLLHRTLDELIQTSEGVNEQKSRRSFQRTHEIVGKEERRRREASRQSSRIVETVLPTLDHQTGEVGKGEGEGKEGDGAPSSAVNGSEEVRSKDDLQLNGSSAKPAQDSFMPELMYHP